MRSKSNLRKCSVDGCDNPHDARGYCNMHYKRWKRGDVRAGDQAHRSYSTPEEAIEARTKWVGGCLEWVGARDRGGYGKIGAWGKIWLAHRLVWVSVNGPIPEGTDIDHMCHNRACVNVAHLREATRGQNGANRRGPEARSVTGVRNVSRNGKGFAVQIMSGGKAHYFGTFPTVSEAAQAAERGRAELFGEFKGNG